MKKSLVKEYESLIRPHVSELYARAYAVKGNRAEAEALTVDAIVWGAKVFSRMKNKDSLTDMIFQKIETGESVCSSYADPDLSWERAVKTMIGNQKKRGIFAIVGAMLLIIAIGVGAVIGFLPDQPEPPSDTDGKIVVNVTEMDNTKTVKGDSGVAELLNYHTISTRLGKKAKPDTFQDRMDYVGRMAASVVAPDGTQYVAYHNIETEDGSNTTFTLYRGEEDGWKAIGTQAVSTALPAYNGYLDFHQAWIYLVADEDSNIYTVTVLDEEIVIYRYDADGGTFTLIKTGATYHMNTLWHYLTVRFDESYGGKGAIYISAVHDGFVELYRYDVASAQTEPFSETLKTGGSTQVVFDVKDDVVYMVTHANQESQDILTYYCLDSDEIIARKNIFISGNSILATKESVKNRNWGSGGIAVDEAGTVHILTTRTDNTVITNARYSIMHYQITSDGTMTKTEMEGLYFKDGYDPTCAGVFEGIDGNVYLIETYKDYAVENFFAIGKLNTQTGNFEYYDSFELPDDLSLNRVKIMNNTFLFYTNEDTICYFYFAEEKR